MQIAKSIVLVDDDVDDHEIFRTACEEVYRGVKVIGFNNGEQALLKLPEFEADPDLIFLDINMPRLNGIEVLKLLKISNQLKNIPVVMYTTSIDRKVKEKCQALGAMGVIEKPNSFDTLCARLSTLLDTLA